MKMFSGALSKSPPQDLVFTWFSIIVANNA